MNNILKSNSNCSEMNHLRFGQRQVFFIKPFSIDFADLSYLKFKMDN